jgi:hypothetical protein
MKESGQLIQLDQRVCFRCIKKSASCPSSSLPNQEPLSPFDHRIHLISCSQNEPASDLEFRSTALTEFGKILRDMVSCAVALIWTLYTLRLVPVEMKLKTAEIAHSGFYISGCILRVRFSLDFIGGRSRAMNVGPPGTVKRPRSVTFFLKSHRMGVFMVSVVPHSDILTRTRLTRVVQFAVKGQVAGHSLCAMVLKPRVTPETLE